MEGSCLANRMTGFNFGSICFTICLEKRFVAESWCTVGRRRKKTDLGNRRITGRREPLWRGEDLWSKPSSKQIWHIRLLGAGLKPLYHHLPGTEEPKQDSVPRHGLRSWLEEKSHIPQPAGCVLDKPALVVVILCCKGTPLTCEHLMVHPAPWVYLAVPSLCCHVGLFNLRYWTERFSALNFMRLLLTLLSRLFIWKTSLSSSASTIPPVGCPLQLAERVACPVV